MRKNGILSVLSGELPPQRWQRSAMWTGLSRILLVCLLSSCGDTALVSNTAQVADDGQDHSQDLELTPDYESTTNSETEQGQTDAADDVQNDTDQSDAEQSDATTEASADDEISSEQAVDGGPLSIMAVGDSITHGFGGATSYRKPLIELLQSSECDFEMVGSMMLNLPETSFESPHEGYSGHRSDAFLTGQQSSFGNNQGISESMSQFSPQLVLIHLGTNDMNQNREIDDVVANIDQIVALIFDAQPQAQVVVSTLVPYFRSTAPEHTVNVRLEGLSNAIEAWVAQAANPQIHLIDIRDGFTEDMMLPDLIHPGEPGDAFLAERFHESIIANGLCI